MLGCIAVLSALQGLQAQTPGLSYPVPLDEAHFPDKRFREYLMGRYIDGDNIDKNGDGQLSVEECGDVTAVGLKIENGLTYVTLTGVSSLKGIEYFYALDSLGFYDSFVTSLDVSRNTALTCLVCWGNELTSLDLSQNTALTYLYCASNQLTSLDVSKNTALTVLYCYGNQLTSLDVSKNTALTVLYCNYNNLAALDLSRNSSLRTVDAVNNYYEVSLDEDGNVDIAAIPGLEADRMTDLQGGHIEGNTLHLDADVLRYYYDYKCPNPNAPSGGYFHITTDNPAYCIPIDKEHFPDTAFRSFVAAYIDRNEDGQLSSVEIGIVTGIDVSYQGIRDLRGIEHFTFLQSLDCSSNQLTSLDVSGCTALTDLSCTYNDLTSLDLSRNTALTELDCSSNQLMSLDVSGCTALTDLSCTYNDLTSLDVSKNTALTELECYNNQLTHLDVSGCTALWTLDCSNNALLDLDVRSLLALRELDCSRNQLASLDLFRNANLVSVKADGNYREVLVNQDRQFDISTLPRFERARMEAIEGGTLQGDILTFEQDEVRYFYSYNNADPNLPLGEYFHLKAVQAPVPGIAIVSSFSVWKTYFSSSRVSSSVSSFSL